MDIRFQSSLTSEDEARLASAIAELITALLDPLGVVYTLRIEGGGITLERSRPTPGRESTADERRAN